jgi:hypothetical protein
MSKVRRLRAIRRTADRQRGYRLLAIVCFSRERGDFCPFLARGDIIEIL